MLTPYLLAALPQAAVIPDQPALIEVKHGRARVVAETGTLQLTSLDPATVARGAAHLEVTAGSVVFVTWRGLATLRFEGPAAFEWGGETDGGELSWRMVDVSALEAEVRRGIARLELPMGWQADFEAGAYHLRTLADGGTCIVHGAGEDVRIRWMGEHGPARPPAFLQAGQSARLAGPPPLAGPPDRTVSAPAWQRYEWPWGVHGIPGRPDLGAGPAWQEAEWPFGPSSAEEAAPWTLVEWPWDAPRPAASQGAVEASPAPAAPAAPAEPDEPVEPVDPFASEPEPEPEPERVAAEMPLERAELAAPAPPLESDLEPASAVPRMERAEGPTPTVEPLPEATPEPSPEPPPQPVSEPAPQPVAPPAPEVVERGPLRHRPNPDLRFEELPDGRWTVSLPADAAEPAQILGQRFDTWILPGGTIHVDANGRLQYHLGPVEMRPSAR